MESADRAKGIDVNGWHPVTDFSLLASSGVRFIGVKATEGLHSADRMLARHRDGLRGIDLDLVIYYHFARSGNAADQAHRLLSMVGDLRVNERLCLDLEVSLGDSVNIEQWLNEFFSVVGSKYPEKRQFVYTSKRVWDSLGGKDWKGHNTELWAPRYNNADLEPRIPTPWKTWKIWQWTDGGDHGPSYSCPGVGACDANYWNGSNADLKKWMGENP